MLVTACAIRYRVGNAEIRQCRRHRVLVGHRRHAQGHHEQPEGAAGGGEGLQYSEGSSLDRRDDCGADRKTVPQGFA
jgi:hypothetical protein